MLTKFDEATPEVHVLEDISAEDRKCVTAPRCRRLCFLECTKCFLTVSCFLCALAGRIPRGSASRQRRRCVCRRAASRAGPLLCQAYAIALFCLLPPFFSTSRP